jgi:hypothetical protein
VRRYRRPLDADRADDMPIAVRLEDVGLRSALAPGSSSRDDRRFVRLPAGGPITCSSTVSQSGWRSSGRNEGERFSSLPTSEPSQSASQSRPRLAARASGDVYEVRSTAPERSGRATSVFGEQRFDVATNFRCRTAGKEQFGNFTGDTFKNGILFNCK